MRVTSAPYLTARPDDGIRTGGGQLKLVAEVLLVAMLRARISAGGGRVGARCVLKEDMDVGIGAIFLNQWRLIWMFVVDLCQMW